MESKNIYAIYPSNDHAFIDLRESKDRSYDERFNVESVLQKWQSRCYEFYSQGREALPAPEATILVGGALAISENLKEALFPCHQIKLSFFLLR